MVIRFSYIELHSDQPERSLEFYGKLLEKKPQFGPDGGGMGVGEAYFAVTRTPEGGPPEFGMDVVNLEPYMERLTNLGVEFEEPSEVDSDGQKFRQITFVDPDGRTVCLFQPLN
jgi:catechol 2,3-dioxygenase-like lactoylglutathione lyase family enzyme